MIDLVISWVAAAGYLGVFALMFLENLFPPIPSELIMPFAGFAAARGELSLFWVIVAGVLGTLLGNVVWFELARAFGADRTRRLCEKYGRWIGVTRADLDKAEQAVRTVVGIAERAAGVTVQSVIVNVTAGRLGSETFSAGVTLGGQEVERADVQRVLPQLAIPPLPCWLAVHREIRASKLVRRVYDFLAEAIPRALDDEH